MFWLADETPGLGYCKSRRWHDLRPARCPHVGVVVRRSLPIAVCSRTTALGRINRPLACRRGKPIPAAQAETVASWDASGWRVFHRQRLMRPDVVVLVTKCL